MAKTVKYKVALVSYLDILGFKELVNTRTAGEISRIIRVFKEVTQPNRFKSKLARIRDDDIANFSDLTIISIPLGNPSVVPRGQLFLHLLHLAQAQAILMCDEGIVIRGGVTVGEIVRSWGQLYGPGIVRAYELESEIASKPRIVVGKEVLEELQSNPRLWLHDRKTDERSVRSLLCKDTDGQYFVDYLRVIFGELDDPDTEYPDLLDRHRRLIDDRLKLYAEKQTILEKYQWLDRYHNATLARTRS